MHLVISFWKSSFLNQERHQSNHSGRYLHWNVCGSWSSYFCNHVIIRIDYLVVLQHHTSFGSVPSVTFTARPEHVVPQPGIDSHRLLIIEPGPHLWQGNKTTGQFVWKMYRLESNKYEPRHDKTNKLSVRPAKIQISLGIRPVRSVFAVRMKKAWVLSYPLSAQRRLIRLGGCPGWSELGENSFCWFCHVVAHILFCHFNVVAFKI